MGMDCENPDRGIASMFEGLYPRLHGRASALLSGERSNHTLEPAALLHEVYLRLGKSPDLTWRSETHFESLASKVMRQVLVDHARSSNRHKRRAATKVTLAETMVTTEALVTDLLDLNDALERLASKDRPAAEVLELRLFSPMTIREVADALDVPYRKAKDDWLYARAWLARELTA